MLNDPKIWGTHLKRREVVMELPSQSSPVNPGAQTQENPSPCTLQTPPLTHDREAHGFTAKSEEK